MFNAIIDQNILQSISIFFIIVVVISPLYLEEKYNIFNYRFVLIYLHNYYLTFKFYSYDRKQIFKINATFI